MRLKGSMSKNVTLPLSSTSSAAGESASNQSETKKRGDNTVNQAFNKKARDELIALL